MTHWGMYWFTRLDYLQGAGTTVFFISAAILLIMLMACIVEQEPWLKRYGLKIVIVGLFGAFITIFTPTQKEASAIWFVPKVINSEQLGNITGNTLSILAKQTQLYLEDKDK